MRKFFVFVFFIGWTVHCFSQECYDSISESHQLILARQYRIGAVVDTDAPKAAAIYSRLARYGNIEAMNELGGMYLNGDGVKRNCVYAYRLFNRAANSGSTKAMCNLADMFLKGIGVNVSLKRAYELYTKAAKQGSVYGLYGQGFMLYKGLGVKQDYEKAIPLLVKAANLKHSGSCFLLGTYYANNFDDNKNLDKAKSYFELASKYGCDWVTDVIRNDYLDSVQINNLLVKNRLSRYKNLMFSLDNPQLKTCNMNALIGEWTGNAYVYDWSKSKIIDKLDGISCNFEETGDSVSMSLYHNDSLITIYTPFEKDDIYVEKQCHEYQKQFNTVIVKSHIVADGEYIYISSMLFNRKKRSFMRPVLYCLRRKESNFVSALKFSSETPFAYKEGNIFINLEINDAIDAKIKLYSIGGVLLEQHVVSLSAGNNNISFPVNVPSGSYIIDF